MPVIPGTDDVYTSNTFMLAKASAFDVPSIVPDDGVGLMSLREYAELNDAIKIKPLGSAGYEYASLYGLFSSSKMYAMSEIIQTTAHPVKGHPSEEWDLTDTADATWLVNEKQLFELMFTNANFYEFDDVVFTCETSSNVNYLGMKLVDKGYLVGDATEYGVPKQIAVDGLYVGTCRVHDGVEDADDDLVITLGHKYGYMAPYKEIMAMINGTGYVLEIYASDNQYPVYRRRDVGNNITDHFKSLIGDDVTVGIMPRY